MFKLLVCLIIFVITIMEIKGCFFSIPKTPEMPNNPDLGGPNDMGGDFPKDGFPSNVGGP